MPDTYRLLLHPVFVLAVATLALNDHVLKPHLQAPLLTGKLSDFAGLCFFPVLLWSALARVAPRRWAPPAGLWTSAALTAAVFTLIQLHPPSAALWAWGLGAVQALLEAPAQLVLHGHVPPLAAVHHTMDSSDLVALPAVLWGPCALRGRHPAAMAPTIAPSPSTRHPSR